MHWCRPPPPPPMQNRTTNFGSSLTTSADIAIRSAYDHFVKQKPSPNHPGWDGPTLYAFCLMLQTSHESLARRDSHPMSGRLCGARISNSYHPCCRRTSKPSWASVGPIITPVSLSFSGCLSDKDYSKPMVKVLVKTMLIVATQYQTVAISNAIDSDFLRLLLHGVAVDPDASIRVYVQKILHALIDRHDNAPKLLAVKLVASFPYPLTPPSSYSLSEAA